YLAEPISLANGEKSTMRCNFAIVMTLSSFINDCSIIFCLQVSAKKETFSSFDDLLANSDKPVLVDFYATWCGPCQFMVPVLEQVSAALKDKIRVVKIDTEKYTSIASKYNIEALPTFIIFKDGKPFDRFVSIILNFF
ncbi:hypothetical protein GIB67_036145, partial [Kingdonia uniflora]